MLPDFFGAVLPLIVVSELFWYYLIIVFVLFDVPILLLRKLLLGELAVGVPHSQQRRDDSADDDLGIREDTPQV